MSTQVVVPLLFFAVEGRDAKISWTLSDTKRPG